MLGLRLLNRKKWFQFQCAFMGISTHVSFLMSAWVKAWLKYDKMDYNLSCTQKENISLIVRHETNGEYVFHKSTPRHFITLWGHALALFLFIDPSGFLFLLKSHVKFSTFLLPAYFQGTISQSSFFITGTLLVNCTYNVTRVQLLHYLSKCEGFIVYFTKPHHCVR